MTSATKGTPIRAWQFTGTHQPFQLVDFPTPKPAPGRVIIDVKAAGICHSDVGIMEDEKWLANMKELPVVPSHENAGVIASVGEGVTEWKVGDRVAVWPMAEFPGYMVDGAWEEQASIGTESLIRIPDGVTFAQAAAATDAGMTSVGAIMGTGGVTAGTKVGVIGFGDLGQIGARVAALNGADVYVAEVNESVWEHTTAAGAKAVAKNITEFKDAGLEVIVDDAGFGTTTADAIETVAFGGKVVQVGMGRLESTINTYALILGKVQLLGSMGGSKADIEETLKWMTTGDLTPAITEIAFDEIADGVQRLHDGKVVGRLVAKVADELHRGPHPRDHPPTGISRGHAVRRARGLTGGQHGPAKSSHRSCNEAPPGRNVTIRRADPEMTRRSEACVSMRRNKSAVRALLI